MARTVIRGGAEIDIPTAREISAVVGEELRAAYRGVKWMRLPQLSGTPSGGALSTGQAGQVGPDSGFAWSLRRLVVNGLTAGGSPDVVNLYANDTGTQPLWQFNGNNFGYSFGPGELVMRPGEILLLKSTGTFTATGTITLSGELVEVPAEMLAKLVTG